MVSWGNVQPWWEGEGALEEHWVMGKGEDAEKPVLVWKELIEAVGFETEAREVSLWDGMRKAWLKQVPETRQISAWRVPHTKILGGYLRRKGVVTCHASSQLPPLFVYLPLYISFLTESSVKDIVVLKSTLGRPSFLFLLSLLLCGRDFHRGQVLFGFLELQILGRGEESHSKGATTPLLSKNAHGHIQTVWSYYMVECSEQLW